MERRAPVYDLVVRGGLVVDPAQGIHARKDVALSNGRVAALGDSIPPDQARDSVDVSGQIVTPGLVDLHVHVFWGVSHFGIPPDPYCLSSGVTTAVDAGSAGADTFPGFRRYVMETARTRLYAFLNISSPGLVCPLVGELEELRYADPERAAATAEENRDLVLGIKARLSDNIVGANGLEPLRRAKWAAEKAGMPVMIHIGHTPYPLRDILTAMAEGDILTHCFTGHTFGILDEDRRVLPETWAAVKRGVSLDVGHGVGSFSFDVARAALAQGLLPNTISSDLHRYNIHGPVFDLATTMSKFMRLGLSLEEVVKLATANPAKAIGHEGEVGTLRVGAAGDLAVFRLAEGEFAFRDAMGKTEIGHRRLVPTLVIRGGERCPVRDSWVDSGPITGPAPVHTSEQAQRLRQRWPS